MFPTLPTLSSRRNIEKTYTGPDPSSLSRPRTAAEAERFFEHAGKSAEVHVLPVRVNKALGIGGWIFGACEWFGRGYVECKSIGRVLLVTAMTTIMTRVMSTVVARVMARVSGRVVGGSAGGVGDGEAGDEGDDDDDEGTREAG